MAFTNSDFDLNTGGAQSQSCQLAASSCSNPFITDAGVDIWRIFANPWGVTSTGSGTSTVDYNGSGTFTMTVDYTGVNVSGVDGFPLIRYGGDIFDSTPILGQGQLVFPVQISAMTSLVVDINYTLNNTTTPTNQDIGFDQWIIPSPTYSGGIPGAFEVFIAPYYNFGGAGSGGGATFVNNFNYNVNGSPLSWSLFSWGSGAGEEQIFCPQGNNQISSGEVSFDMLPMLKQAIASAGGGTVTDSWYLANMDFGTEWGESANVNYNVQVSKLLFEQGFPTLYPSVFGGADDFHWGGGEAY